MVAISLYRGNLHRVPDVPWRWVSPSPKISLKNFKKLLSRRSAALSRHHSLSPSNPNQEDADPHPPETATIIPKQEEPAIETDAADEGVAKVINGPDPLPEPPQINGEMVDSSLAELTLETTDVVAEPSDTEQKIKEIQEKLEVLNAKKHDLVKLLKQILNAEEELKRRNSTQGMGMLHPCNSLQVDVTNDSGSLSRLTTPRLNSDGNLARDIERGETDDTSNHNPHSRHLVRTTSVSPSSDSIHRRSVFSAVPHPRANLGGVGSPSRFAPVGHPTNLPTAVCTSGASYIASSPSPAASGSTSAFRENQQPSPWN